MEMVGAEVIPSRCRPLAPLLALVTTCSNHSLTFFFFHLYTEISITSDLSDLALLSIHKLSTKMIIIHNC